MCTFLFKSNKIYPAATTSGWSKNTHFLYKSNIFYAQSILNNGLVGIYLKRFYVHIYACMNRFFLSIEKIYFVRLTLSQNLYCLFWINCHLKTTFSLTYRTFHEISYLSSFPLNTWTKTKFRLIIHCSYKMLCISFKCVQQLKCQIL